MPLSPKSRMGVLAFSLVGVAFLVCGGGLAALVFSGRGRGTGDGMLTVFATKPRAANQGENWTMADLVNYLRKNGIQFREMGSADRHIDHYSLSLIAGDNIYAVIKQFQDARSARDNAGSGRNGLSWGRFAIFFPEPERERIRGLLAD